MQTPPPFHGYEGQMQPQKPKTNGLVILFAVLGVLLVCCGLPAGFLGYFGFKGFKGAMNIGGCMVNVETMRSALQSYESAHDGKLPNASTWQTDIGKYWHMDKDTENAPMQIWKPGGEWTCDDGKEKTGFMFNEEMSGKSVSQVLKNNPQAVAIFETKTSVFNQAGKFETMPFDQSPKIFGEFTDKRRGWIFLPVDGSRLLSRNKSGKIINFDFNSKKDKNGFSFDINSDSSDSKGSKSSDDSSDSKNDNSN